MATLASPRPSSPLSSPRMPSRRWARKCERYCCLGATYFPLAFVYSITSWAVWVEGTIGFLPTKDAWIGKWTSLLGIAIYVMLNWSYTKAVFTSPGTTTMGHNGYGPLPMQTPPSATNFTVKSNGELRFCKKCQARKPDRAHHCSTCKTCVLKMDHHCPWLATCVGLRNYKFFLLFLIYTTLFCFLCFGVSATWVYREILSDGEYQDSLMPVNYVMLAVISGIIGIVLAGFTGWHILLASRGQTTIECLEKTRYLSPWRKSMRGPSPPNPENAGPGYASERPPSLKPEERVEHHQGGDFTRQQYDAYERQRARDRYEEYLDEQDADKLPSAFDLGWRANLLHLFGEKRALWAFPILTTTGNGWNWEPSPKWLEARERIAAEREDQRIREHAAGWGEPASDVPSIPRKQMGAARHYINSYPTRPQSKADQVLGRPVSKADRILGRKPEQYTDADGHADSVSLQNLKPRTLYDQFDDVSEDEEEELEQRALDRKATTGWPQKVGVATNTLLGNTLARQKANSTYWEPHDDDGGVD